MTAATQDSPLAGCRMSLEDFFNWEPEPDGWKLEWKDGVTQSGEFRMQSTEWGLIFALGRCFDETTAHARGDMLMPTPDCFLPLVNAVRTPDFGYLTSEQIDQGTRGQDPVPAWVIEVASPRDHAGKMEQKIAEYFQAGVELVWHIFPSSQSVRIYRSTSASNILHGNDICSAAPVVADFAISVNNLFSPPSTRRK